MDLEHNPLPAWAGTGGTMPKLATVARAQYTFNMLKPEFEAWLQAVGIEDPEEVTGIVNFVLSICATRDYMLRATGPSTKTLKEVLVFVSEQYDGFIGEAKRDMVRYLEYLDESDEFTGSDELWEELYNLVYEGRDDDDLEGMDSDGPDWDLR